jgi:NAD+ kinase
MPKPRVLLVYKESAFSRLRSGKGLSGSAKKGDYWKIVRGSHRRHNATLRGVKEVLRERGLAVTLLMRHQVSRRPPSDSRFLLVVTVGGDGTLLDSSHHLLKTPILGVNSDPERSVARFSGSDLKSFPRILDAYLAGRAKPVPVFRLEFSINGRKNPLLVLNDLLVATLSPGGTSRYRLKVGPRSEEQMSSGIWISTAAGSTAANLSAGGRALPAFVRKFQYVVREAYQRKFGPRRLVKGVLPAGRSLEVVSHMKDGRIFVDGASLAVPFGLGDKLRVDLSNKPLKVIGLRR